MRKKLLLVLVAVGLICFLSLVADDKKVVSKDRRKEKIGNQLEVEKADKDENSE
jgi:predicted RND superfamily exporter protein